MFERTRARLTQPSTGIACAIGTSLLCGVGSVLFRTHPNFFLRHFGGWWMAPRWHSIWLCGLSVAVALWSVHAVLRMREAVENRAHDRVNFRWSLRVGALHLGWVLALAAYLWIEVYPHEERFEVTAKAIDIHGESYHALRVEERGRRPGSRRQITAWLERRARAGTDRLRASCNVYWESKSGTHLLRMERANVVSDGVILRHGHRRLELHRDKPLQEGSETIILNSIRDAEPQSAVSVPKVDVTIGKHRELLPLDPEWIGEDAFLGFKESPILVLRVRRNIGNSLAVVAIGSLLMGCILIVLRKRSATRPTL